MDFVNDRDGRDLSTADVLANFVRILHTPAAIFEPSGGIRQINNAWADISGPAAAHIRQLVAPTDQHVMDDCLRELSSTICPQPFEVHLATGRWAQIQIQPFERIDDGLWLCTAADIDELKSRYDILADHTRMQRDLLDASGDCIKLIDLTGRLTYMNDVGCKTLLVDPTSGFGQDWLQLLPKEVRATAATAFDAAAAGESARFSGRIQQIVGASESWDCLLTPMIDNGTVTSILCVARNVSDEHAAREALRESQERLTLATRVGGIGIWDFDLQSNRLFCDDTWHNIMGRDPSQPISSMDEFRPMIHPDDLDQATEVPQTVATLMATEQDYTNTFRIIRPDGEIRWVRSAACLVLDHTGEPVRAIGFVIDITDSLHGQMALQKANQTLEMERAILEQQSLEDALTGLPNRRSLTAELDRIVTHARRTGDPVSVSMIDLDYFKRYNDHFGHLEGDSVLMAFAGCLKQVARRSDSVARYGGEEFILIQTGTTDPQPAIRRLFELLDEVALPHPKSPYGQVTISCGCATFSDGLEVEPEDMLKAADQALYEAKTAGRNRFILR